jgi:hypothetical protein
MTRTLQAALVYKDDRWNSWLRFIGGYPDEGLTAALVAAGWTKQDPDLPRVSEGTLDRYPDLDTEDWAMPTGSGLFGLRVQAEAEPYITALRRVLQQHNVPLFAPRKLALAEML